MEPLKEMFNKKFYEGLALQFYSVDKNFPTEKFVKAVTQNLSERELNQRMRHTSVVLKEFLPADYKATVSLMRDVIQRMPRGYTSLLFPDYVGLYGHHDINTSLEALKFFTQFGSSEFAIREFLRNDFTSVIKTLYTWAEDDSHHVRRLASEGSRSRLPWSFRLDDVIKNPKVTRPILETLKGDQELYVQKSVANHLNDLSKDHPAVVLDIIKSWKDHSDETNWIIKHASRTMLKKGDASVLKVFGLHENKALVLDGFRIHSKKVKSGAAVEFSFRIKNTSRKKTMARIEYAMYFKRQKGESSKKVFKISERELLPNELISYTKTYSFKPITTRVYYKGVHRLSVIVNGKESKSAEFILL